MDSLHFDHPFRYAKDFPEMKGDWLYGSIEKGLQHVIEVAESGPENLSYDVRGVLYLLQSKYTEARKLHTRDVAKSDPLPLDQPKGRIHDLAREIRNAEVLLHSFQHHARSELKNLEVDQQLAAALIEAACG